MVLNYPGIKLSLAVPFVRDRASARRNGNQDRDRNREACVTDPERECVLFVSPGPDVAVPSSGHGARLHHLSRGLAESGDWDVLGLVPEGTTADQISWLEACYTYDQWDSPFLTDYNPSFLRTLARVLAAHDVDVIHLSNGVCGARALAALRRADATVVYGAQNVEADHARDYVDESLPVHKRVLGPRLIPLIERLTVACADRVTTVSEADRRSFRERYGVDEARIAAIPTGTTPVDAATLPPKRAVRERFGVDAETVAVFHGWYDHRPNREAVETIETVLAPAIRERGVDLEFLLVGKGMPDSDVPGVTSVGFVDELFPALHAADLAAVPILHGGGTKTKVYDYVSLGLPMVTTERGIAGIDLDPGTHCLVTDGVGSGFVDALVELATDDARRRAMRDALRAWARDHSWERSVDRLDAFYRAALGAGARWR